MALIHYLTDTYMIPFLSFSYTHIYHNYGVAIILLTILIKLVLYPLTHKQFQSMKKMQELQPLFQSIREKHKKDPQKLQQETMKLYKEHQVNPLGGCLPMLIQIPFLFALFYTMKSEAFNALLSAPNVFPGLTSFWIPRLDQPDSLYLLPIIIGVTTYISQKFSVTTMNAQQQKIMMLMPIFMVAICFTMPSGVLLYWAVSQIISNIQQYFMFNPVEKEVVRV